MNCWNCGTVLEAPFLNKLSFRAVCDKCLASLHCCSNCQFHKPHYSNQCMVPGTEPVLDRTANNFCEEFVVLGKAPEQKNDTAKKRFDALFKD